MFLPTVNPISSPLCRSIGLEKSIPRGKLFQVHRGTGPTDTNSRGIVAFAKRAVKVFVVWRAAEGCESARQFSAKQWMVRQH